MDKQPDAPQPEKQKETADLLYNQSLKLINDAIQACNLGDFMTASLNIPQSVDSNIFSSKVASAKQDFFSTAKDLFAQQEQLFSEQINEQASEGNPATTEAGLSAQDILLQEALPQNLSELAPEIVEQQTAANVINPSDTLASPGGDIKKEGEESQGNATGEETSVQGPIQPSPDDSLAAITELLNSG